MNYRLVFFIALSACSSLAHTSSRFEAKIPDFVHPPEPTASRSIEPVVFWRDLSPASQSLLDGLKPYYDSLTPAERSTWHRFMLKSSSFSLDQQLLLRRHIQSWVSWVKSIKPSALRQLPPAPKLPNFYYLVDYQVESTSAIKNGSKVSPGK